jgi:2-hydroxy-6-oxonona-2,4-dienedioate hydrolase
MGCMNTANYVVAHPDRILSYILIAGDLGDVLPPGLRPPAQSQLTRWDGTADGMRTMMTAIIYRNEAISDDLISMRTMSATSHADAHAHYWPSLLQFGRIVPWEDENLAARMSTKGRLDRMTLPALYLYGQQDVLTPVEGLRAGEGPPQPSVLLSRRMRAPGPDRPAGHVQPGLPRVRP